MDQVIAKVTAPGGEEIAYASVGDGPVLVLAAWWTSHLEDDWQNDELRRFIESLAQHRTVVRYDRPGVGLSSRGDRPYDLASETTYLKSVVEATGSDDVDLLGISCGGPSSVRLAAEEPERIRSLMLFASYVTGTDIADDATRRAVTDLVRANWGIGSQTLAGIFLADASSSASRRFSRTQRQTATADVAADLINLTFELDAAPYVGRVDLPVLVMHRAHDRVVECRLGRELAERIAGATYAEFEGKAHIPWAGDSGPVVESVLQFLGVGGAVTPSRRQLATICFVDIVGSTRILAEVGDARWRERLEALTRLTTDEAVPRGGTIIKDTGDGSLLRFDMPGEAVAFCRALGRRVNGIDLRIRCGIHIGEIEVRGDGDITGLTVNVASRVSALAEADEILITRTVADLIAGSGVGTEDHGAHRLAGLSGEWPLLRVQSDTRGQPSAESAAAGGVYHFDDYRLDVATFELHRGSTVIPLEPQVFDVLRYLVENRGRMITKEQLLDEVWGDRFVGDATLASRIRAARQAVGDDGKRQAVIRTIHGRGYRFVAEVR